MPKLKAPEKGRTSTITAALDPPTRRSLKLYARMLSSSEEYVVVEALKDLFSGDPDFAAWVAKNGDQPGDGHGAEDPSKAQPTARPMPGAVAGGR